MSVNGLYKHLFDYWIKLRVMFYAIDYTGLYGVLPDKTIFIYQTRSIKFRKTLWGELFETFVDC